MNNRAPSTKRSLPQDHPHPGEPRFAWMTRTALMLAIALVVARALMQESIRDPFQVELGQEAPPRGAGPATGLILDLLCCVPALLVLLRAAVDRSFFIRKSWSNGFMLALGGWLLCSPLWASDKFFATIAAAHWGSGLALLWAGAQLVRGWIDFRIISAAALGLLLALAAQGIVYKFVDLPELQAQAERDWPTILEQRRWEPGSFIEQQFKRRISGGEVMGYSASPNSFGAMLVMLGLLSAGIALQRMHYRHEFGWALIVMLALVPAAMVLYFTQSRTALATPVLGAILITIAWNMRGWIARNHVRLFIAGVATIALLFAAIIGHGLWHGTLFHSSLTFRWNYWVGAWRVYIQHPLVGVGFGNFGLHYLSTRLPHAAEEINDPHNFIVRLFVELGVVGGILLVAWMLRLWWELTRPQLASRTTSTFDHSVPMRRILQLVGCAAAINILAAVDLSLGWFTFLEVLRRLLFVLLLVIGLIVGTFRSSRQPEFDDRPAPLLLYAAVVAIGIFLVHNLIDFSLFEIGPFYMCCLIVGAVLGIRMDNPRSTSRLAVYGAAVVTTLLWVAFALGIVAPVIVSEREARLGDERLRAAQPLAATDHYQRAFEFLWIPNGDYAFRAARGMIVAGYAPDRVRAMIARAIEASPMNAAYPRMRAQFERTVAMPDFDRIVADYERVTELDPNDLVARIEFGEVLAHAGRNDQAIEQYREALRRNDLFSPDEPERLTQTKIQEIEREIERLR